MAWLIDVCASHTDQRQAVFVEHADRQIDAVFIDHGHLFGGATDLERAQPKASHYLDSRMYVDLPRIGVQRIENALRALDVAVLRNQMQELPVDWISESAWEAFEQCLERLKEPKEWENVLAELITLRERTRQHEPPPHATAVEASAVLPA